MEMDCKSLPQEARRVSAAALNNFEFPALSISAEGAQNLSHPAVPESGGLLRTRIDVCSAE
jgi:hypothetical protein